jgi:hypothetical protein
VTLLFEVNPDALAHDLKSAAISKEFVVETFRVRIPVIPAT